MSLSPAFPDVERRFRDAIAAAVGLEPERFERSGTSIGSSSDRQAWGTASAFSIGRHTLIWCDPAVVDRVASLADTDSSFPIDAIEKWAAAHDAEFVGGGWSHLIDERMLREHGLPDGGQLVELDRDDQHDLDSIGDLVAASGADDLDAAEISLGSLDPVILGVVDPHGRLAAFASERPWEQDAGFGNIGVLVRVDRRGHGWGAAVVTALCQSMFAVGRLPLYRCNWDREASRRLALAVGFRQVAAVAAVRFG